MRAELSILKPENNIQQGTIIIQYKQSTRNMQQNIHNNKTNNNKQFTTNNKQIF